MTHRWDSHKYYLPGQSKPEFNGKERVLDTELQNWSLTTRCSSVSYLGHSFFQRMQLVYSEPCSLREGLELWVWSCIHIYSWSLWICIRWACLYMQAYFGRFLQPIPWMIFSNKILISHTNRDYIIRSSNIQMNYRYLKKCSSPQN